MAIPTKLQSSIPSAVQFFSLGLSLSIATNLFHVSLPNSYDLPSLLSLHNLPPPISCVSSKTLSSKLSPNILYLLQNSLQTLPRSLSSPISCISSKLSPASSFSIFLLSNQNLHYDLSLTLILKLSITIIMIASP